MKIKLHYAPLILTKDIECFEFNNYTKLFEFIDDKLGGDEFTSDKVILINIENEILVTDNISFNEGLVEDFIRFMCYDFDIDEDVIDIVNIYFQEYYSYEEAYQVAITMKEENALCYKRIFPLSKN